MDLCVSPHEEANLVVEEVVIAYNGVAKSIGCSGIVGGSRSIDRVSWLSVGGVPEALLWSVSGLLLVESIKVL